MEGFNSVTYPPAPDLPRAVPLEGASNLRDIGGWATRDGGRLRFGQVFRSAALGGLTPTDQAYVAGLNITRVADLRGVAEAARAPSALPPGIARHALPIEPSVGASLRDIAATRAATGEDVLTVLRRAYEAYALDWAHRYRALIDLLLAEEAPLLFHCAAGKDRTGFGAALILTAVDVHPDDVTEDYLASNRLWRGDSELARDLPPDAAEYMLKVHAELLHAAFDAIVREHGSVERYLQSQLGLTPPNRARLRARLIR